jgi:hypothetical protein
MSTVDVREPEEPPDAVQHGVDRGVPQSTVVEVADVELEVGPLQTDERVQALCQAPGEPATQLVGVQPVGVPGIPSQVETAASWAGVIASGWNGRTMVVIAASDDLETMAWSRTAAHGEVT